MPLSIFPDTATVDIRTIRGRIFTRPLLYIYPARPARFVAKPRCRPIEIRLPGRPGREKKVGPAVRRRYRARWRFSLKVCFTRRPRKIRALCFPTDEAGAARVFAGRRGRSPFRDATQRSPSVFQREVDILYVGFRKIAVLFPRRTPALQSTKPAICFFGEVVTESRGQKGKRPPWAAGACNWRRCFPRLGAGPFSNQTIKKKKTDLCLRLFFPASHRFLKSPEHSGRTKKTRQTRPKIFPVCHGRHKACARRLFGPPAPDWRPWNGTKCAQL